MTDSVGLTARALRVLGHASFLPFGVRDRINLTPVALMEGHCFADTEFGNKPRKANHLDVPSAVFCQPELATVGLTEEQARLTLSELRVYTSAFRPMKSTISGRQQRTFMKLIVEAATDKVVGVHMVGDDAAELVQGLAVAVKAGATKAQFDATVGIHPTAGEEFVTMRTARVEPAPRQKAAERPSFAKASEGSPPEGGSPFIHSAYRFTDPAARGRAGCRRKEK